MGEKGVPGRSTGLGTDLLMEVLVRGSGTWRSGNVDTAGGHRAQEVGWALLRHYIPGLGHKI